MKVLIKKAKIYQSNSPFHLQQKDLLIENGVISKIDDAINTTADKVVEAEGLSVSMGWIDMNVQVGDPGFEHHEDLTTALDAAANGGFTRIGVMPNSFPVVDSKSQVEYLKNRSQSHLVEVYPIGSISEKAEGKNISEMYDMHLSGAMAFSDGKKSISANLLKKSLLYTDKFLKRVIVFSEDESIAQEGVVNESENTIHLGMKVRPSLAENIEVRRNIELLRYTGGAIHLTGISSKESVQAIREAKAEGLNVSADSAISNVVFTDKDYSNFDSAWKVLPMLRTEEDAKSIIEGLEDGTIDFVSSHHDPKDKESKDLEFDRAAFGISSIETLFSSWSNQSIDVESLIKGLSENTREVFDLNRSEIKEGEKAEITLFSEELTKEYSSNNLKSRSKSSPFLNQTLKGSVIGVINGSQIMLS